jgi:hypothetical protein
LLEIPGFEPCLLEQCLCVHCGGDISVHLSGYSGPSALY